MKALIIKKEWLDKIFDEGKIWEMRSKRTYIRGRILLIESGSGHIMGEAILIGCPSSPIPIGIYHFDKHKVEDVELLKKWCYPWILSDVKRYENPIPYKHPKGAVVWVSIPDEDLIYHLPEQK